MVVNVVRLCGAVCIDRNDGVSLREAIQSALATHARVVVDFAGVKTLTGSFLSEAVGRLFGEYAAVDLANRLSFEGLDAVDNALLKLVEDHAIRFYELDKKLQDRLVDSEKEIAGSI